MATSKTFNGRLIKLPGVYSEVKSAISNPPANLSYGNIVIVDMTDSVFSGGAGVAGVLESGQDTVYPFDNIVDFRNFIKGGILWDIASPLFRPFNSGHNGASIVYYVRPLATVPAEVSLAFTNGTIELQVNHEGTSGNGVEVSSVLSQGFAMTLEAGLTNSAKYRVRFLRGSFTGTDDNSQPWNNIPAGEETPELVAITPEIATLDELVAWMSKDVDFVSNFTIKTGGAITGAIDSDDLVSFASNQLFAGGTQVFSSAHLQTALDSIKNLDYTHILSSEYGSDLGSISNFSILYHLENEAKYEKFLVVGANDDQTGFADSLAGAASYNSDRVVLIHGANYDSSRGSAGGMRQKTSLHKAAYVLGRTAGIEPQTPPTFKGIGIAGEVHKLTDREREQALDAGLLTTYYDSEIEAFVITQGINTLQNNDNVVNEDGTSHLWSVKRIAAQLNKEIEVNAKRDLLGDQNQGPNRNTLSEEVVQDYIENYLRRKTATETVDNLIVRFRNIVAVIEQDYVKVSYEFEPNFEINKMFVTGFMIDRS